LFEVRIALRRGFHSDEVDAMYWESLVFLIKP